MLPGSESGSQWIVSSAVPVAHRPTGRGLGPLSIPGSIFGHLCPGRRGEQGSENLNLNVISTINQWIGPGHLSLSPV